MDENEIKQLDNQDLVDAFEEYVLEYEIVEEEECAKIIDNLRQEIINRMI